MNQPVRVALWSGPRNISTAMMRAWGSRADTFVVDEPFYAFYLNATGNKHPGGGDVIASGETDWRRVITKLTGPIPGDKPIFFQKQMAHHLLPEVDRQWLTAVTNCFLIRDPREVIASYVKKREDPTLPDLGFTQQAEIFDFVRARASSVPPVVDAKDVLENPKRVLHLLCEAIGISFSDSMLSWPTGLRESDGVWARHWYGEVAKTTSFQLYQPKEVKIPMHLQEIHDRCRECYDRLYEYKLV